MANVKFGIGLVGVVAVAFANVATTWAQSNELPRRLGERISRTLVDEGFPSAAGAFDTEVKINPSDTAYDFGYSVAISGDTAIVGSDAIVGDEWWYPFGTAYVYARDEGGADNWGEVTKLIAIDPVNAFSRSVAISDNTVIVGGCWDCGGAYVFFEIQVCLDDAECADGDVCNGDETCNIETSRCLPGIPIPCDDGDVCNGVESCDPETGSCIDGELDDCDHNGIDDVCDLIDCAGDPGCDDCDGNGALDRCDIAGGQPDENDDGVLDECEPCIVHASCEDSYDTELKITPRSLSEKRIEPTGSRRRKGRIRREVAWCLENRHS